MPENKNINFLKTNKSKGEFEKFANSLFQVEVDERFHNVLKLAAKYLKPSKRVMSGTTYGLKHDFEYITRKLENEVEWCGYTTVDEFNLILDILGFEEQKRTHYQLNGSGTYNRKYKIEWDIEQLKADGIIIGGRKNNRLVQIWD